jgi:uncharacterized membrane protein YhaH (DUF805 family)
MPSSSIKIYVSFVKDYMEEESYASRTRYFRAMIICVLLATIIGVAVFFVVQANGASAGFVWAVVASIISLGLLSGMALAFIKIS